MKQKSNVQIDKQKSTKSNSPNLEKRLKELGLHTNTELTFTLFSCPIEEIVHFDDNNKKKKND